MSVMSEPTTRTRDELGSPRSAPTGPSRILAGVLVASMALALTGCNGAFWGNLVVLGITVGIFFGTLALGRTAPSPSAEASTSTQSSRR